jgi:hypothetical protein
MYWYAGLSVVALVIAVRLYGYIQWRRLNWPSSLSYYAFRRNTIRALRRYGWTIDTRVWVPFDLWADRKGTRLCIILVPPGMDVTFSQIKDATATTPAMTQGRTTVIVSYAKVQAHLVEEAARGKVRVVWYKELPLL